MLRKFADYPRRLADLGDSYYSSYMFDENKAQQDGITRRETGFVQSPGEWIVSGPHFYVANPFHQTPKRVSETHRAYDCVDLESIPDDYLPRTNYRPNAIGAAYLSHIPRVPWAEPGYGERRPVTDFFRLAFRRQLSQSGERTLLSAVFPPAVAHIHPVLSLTFRDEYDLVNFASSTASVIYDFFVKSTGRSDVYETTLRLMPLLDRDPRRDLRLLSLVCVGSYWRQLWTDVLTRHSPGAAVEKASWSRNAALRTPLVRRKALIENDVLVAQSLGLSLDQLLLVYRVQFPVLQQYERDTWYDTQGRIIFTSSKGLPGVGLPRKAGKKHPEVTLTFPNGRIQRGRIGWEDIQDVPAGTLVSVTVTDDTLPDGPHQWERIWEAPFCTANREEDYRIAWEFFAAASENGGAQ